MSEEEFYLRRDLFLNELDKQNIDYIYEDYIQKEKEYKKEIKRLNNNINKAIEFLKDECMWNEEMNCYCDDLWCGRVKSLESILKGSDKE